MAQDRFNVNVSLSTNWSHLKRKYVGTGHPDITKHEWAVNMHRDTLASHLGHPDQLLYFATAEGVSTERVRVSMLERMVEPCGPKPRRLRGTREGEVVHGGLQKQLEDAAAKAEQAAGGSGLKVPVIKSARDTDDEEHDEFDMDAGAAGRAGDGEDEEDEKGGFGRRKGGTDQRGNGAIRFVPAGGGGAAAGGGGEGGTSSSSTASAAMET